MPTTLTLAEHLDVVARAALGLAADAETAGLDAPVPTCPGWAVRDLVVHLGGVHRWAAAMVAGARTRNFPPDELHAVMAAPADDTLLDWFGDGAEQLTAALAAAPPDLRALVFLRDSPGPREFWARRQAHETTIHRVDALAARLGHLATTSQAAVDRDLAVDGIDEVLTGFITRPSGALRTESPIVVAVTPTDADVGWTLRLSAEPVVTTEGADPDADALVTGTAADLYLGLWNRGDEIAVTGEPEFLGVWRDKVRISWS